MDRQHIQGATRLVGLLGWPVAHSVSPQIHNHLFANLGIDMAYVPMAVPSESLHAAVHALRACGFAGANVTVPHKAQVVNYCDRVSPLSARIGAVNTLYFEKGMLCGTTTDAEGFMRALAWMDHDPSGGRVIILGNGGTARTLGYSMALDAQVASLTLAGRNADRVGRLAAEIADNTGFGVRSLTLDTPEFAAAMQTCTLCVNSTSAGMHPHVDVSAVPPDVFHAGMAVVDAIYNPAQTLLLKHAEAAGCSTQNGLRMLLYQGLASFTRWTGVEVDESLIDIKELQSQVTGN